MVLRKGCSAVTFPLRLCVHRSGDIDQLQLGWPREKSSGDSKLKQDDVTYCPIDSQNKILSYEAYVLDVS